MFWKIAVLENIEQFLGKQPSKMFSFGFCDIRMALLQNIWK